MVIDFDPNLAQPMTVVDTKRWADGLFDVCWSEKIPGVCCTAGGDGNIVLWSELKPVCCSSCKIILLYSFVCKYFQIPSEDLLS